MYWLPSGAEVGEMQLPKPTSNFQLSVAAAAVVAVGCCLISTPNMGRVKAAQPAVFQQEAPPSPNSARKPVLVEFFPSEECPKCPAVDADLARLGREQPISNAQVIVLRENADSLDEADPNFHYSFEEFSRRLQGYQELFRLDSISRPQVVVNGAVQAKGTSSREIDGAIAEAVKETNAVALQFASVQVHAGSIDFILGDCPETPRYVNVIAALVDPMDTVDVGTGDNGVQVFGQAGVVRTFGIVGSSFRTRAVGGKHFWSPFYLPGVDSHLRGVRAALEGKRLVVFVQVKHVGPVIGVASCTLHLGRQHAGDKQSIAQADPCPISDSF